MRSRDIAKKILFFYENGMHPKTKIDYKKYCKDKNAKKIFDVMMKKDKIKNKDLRY